MTVSDRHTVIVCDWLPPAFGAVGQYMMQRAEKLAAEGQTVSIVGLGERDSAEEKVIGPGRLTIRRVGAVGTAKGGSLVKRGLWALQQALKLMGAANERIATTPKAGTEILVTGSPPFLSYIFIVVNWIAWRRDIIYRITDFYPETVFAAGYMPWLKPIEGLFHLVRKAATRIEALGEDQKRRLAEGGMPEGKIVVVRDGAPFAPDAPVRPLPRAVPEDKVMLLYSGNMGVAHDTDTILAAYERHVRQGSDRVRIWVNGTGARLGPFADECRARNLPIVVTPPVPIEDLPSVLHSADAHLVLQKPEFWGYVLPSKIYACLPLPAPLLFIGPTQSDVDLLGRQRTAPYIQVDVGDVEGCASALEKLADEVMKTRDADAQIGGPAAPVKRAGGRAAKKDIAI